MDILAAKYFDNGTKVQCLIEMSKEEYESLIESAQEQEEEKE